MTDSRNIFSELVEGFEALAAEREGKKTLRHHKMEVKEISTVTPERLSGAEIFSGYQDL